MYQQAETAVRDPRAYADVAVKTATLSKPRLQQQIDELYKILAGCHEIAGDLDRAADRMCGTQPQEASKSAPTPEPNSMEARLQAAIGYADRLAQRLHSTGQRLNGAV